MEESMYFDMVQRKKREKKKETENIIETSGNTKLFTSDTTAMLDFVRTHIAVWYICILFEE